MTESLTIRAATPADAGAYERFLTDLFAEDLDTVCPRAQNPTSVQVHLWLATHDGDSSVVLLAFEGEQLLGTLNLSQLNRPNLDHSVGLGLNVKAGMRGKGIGRALLRAGLAWFAQVHHIERIELEVTGNNAAALHLYQSFGFIQEGRKQGAVKKGMQYFDLLIMALRKNDPIQPGLSAISSIRS